MVFQDLDVLSDVESHELCGSISAQPALLRRRSGKGRGQREKQWRTEKNRRKMMENRGIFGD